MRDLTGVEPRTRTGQQQTDKSQVVLEGPDSGKDLLSDKLALERIQSLIRTRHNVVFEGERGVGKKHHAALLHCETVNGVGGSFVEIMPDTPNDFFRVILFDEDRKLLEGKSGKPLPSLAGRSTLYVHDIDQFAFMDQILLSRFLIQQQQRPSTLTRVVISTTGSWSDLLRKLADSFARSVEGFELCRIPPLRDRLDELPSLVRGILTQFRQRQKVSCWKVTAELLQQLKSRSWRDNIRELKYKIEESAVSSTGDTLAMPESGVDEIDLVWETFQTIQAGKRLTIDQSLVALEKAIIVRALMECGFDPRRTARRLEMTEPNLNYRIKKFNIYVPSPK